MRRTKTGSRRRSSRPGRRCKPRTERSETRRSRAETYQAGTSQRGIPEAERLAGPVITCEHGGNDVPARYASRFARAKRDLRTHRGFDMGALWLSRRLAAALGAPLVVSKTSRLLVDLNRSLESPDLFSRYVRGLPEEELGAILERHYEPHRRRVEATLERAARRPVRYVPAASGSSPNAAYRRSPAPGVPALQVPVLHIAVHTFTPRLRGVVRRADAGILYDPASPAEADLARRLRRELRRVAPRLAVWLNYPYRGWTDGLAASLRRKLGPRRYVGIELEVSQRLLRRPDARARRVASALAESLKAIL